MGNYLITDIVGDLKSLYKKCEDTTYIIRYDELKRIAYEIAFLYVLDYSEADKYYILTMNKLDTNTVPSRRKNFKIIFEDIINDARKILEEK